MENIFDVVERNDLDLLEEILSKAPDQRDKVYSPDLSFQPIHLAAWLDYPDIVNMLLDHGADIQAKGEYGRSPLHYAVYEGSLQTTSLLITRGAKANAQDETGFTPLFVAVRSRKPEQEEIRQMLLDNGAVIDLNMAACMANLSIIQNILTDDPDAVRNATFPNDLIYDAVIEIAYQLMCLDHELDTPVDYYTPIQEYLTLLDTLIVFGAKVDGIGFATWTALFVAIQMKHIEIARFLLERGANVHFRTPDGLSLMDVISRMDNSAEKRALLYEYGYQERV